MKNNIVFSEDEHFTLFLMVAFIYILFHIVPLTVAHHISETAVGMFL